MPTPKKKEKRGAIMSLRKKRTHEQTDRDAGIDTLLAARECINQAHGPKLCTWALQQTLTANRRKPALQAKRRTAYTSSPASTPQRVYSSPSASVNASSRALS